MTGIGLRVVSDSKVYFCIIERTDTALNFLDRDFIQVPLSLDAPERFNFIRNTLMDIFELYEVTRAAIRIPEFSSLSGIRQTAIDRYHLEGVIQESIAGSKIEKYVAGRIATLARFLDFPKTDFKKFAEADKDFEDIPSSYNWKKLKLAERESILACYAALNL